MGHTYFSGSTHNKSIESYNNNEKTNLNLRRKYSSLPFSSSYSQKLWKHTHFVMIVCNNNVREIENRAMPKQDEGLSEGDLTFWRRILRISMCIYEEVSSPYLFSATHILSAPRLPSIVIYWWRNSTTLLGLGKCFLAVRFSSSLFRLRQCDIERVVTHNGVRPAVCVWWFVGDGLIGFLGFWHHAAVLCDMMVNDPHPNVVRRNVMLCDMFFSSFFLCILEDVNIRDWIHFINK